MKNARRIGALALCLAAVTSSASAECAWVLWQKDTKTIERFEEEWRPPVAYRDRESCVAYVSKLVATWRDHKNSSDPDIRQHVDEHPSGTTADFLTWGKNGGIKITVFCLPDTVDPRGPKGK